MTSLLACCTIANEEEKEARNRSKAIDHKINEEKHIFKKTIKLLLLGAGESGKSTFLKQMRIIHGLNYDDVNIQEFKQIIYMNIVKGLKVLIDARSKLGIPWGNERNAKHGSLVFESGVSNMPTEEDYLPLAPSIKILWRDSGILEAFDRRREFQLTDSLQYFMDNIDRVSVAGYTPDTKDILHARKPTKGIHEQAITVKNIPFVFVDVGGQRSQRTKWFQCFDNVTSILFLASSSEFDQVIVEDRRTNRLEESLNIFDTIVNNKTFSSMSIILFLNKTDLLEKKIAKVKISKYYDTFEGDPHNLADVQKFLLAQFDSRRQDRSKPLFHHFTTAVDTENIKFVFRAVRDTILQDNLKSLMLQ